MNFSSKISLILIFLIATFNSFSQSEKIITSKEEALKKGIYFSTNTENAIAYNELKTKKEKIDRNFKEKKTKSYSDKDKTILNTKNAKDIIIETEEISYLTEQILHNAMDNIGVNYSYGGTSKNGFDCSGLVYTTFKKFDIELPRSSSNMADVGQKTDPSNAKKGDLIFFATGRGKRISHVGIISDVNDGEILFVHSSTSEGVIISSLSETYYQNTFVQINRILEN